MDNQKNVEPATEEDPLTQGRHDWVDACHVFGDQPLGVRFSCCTKNNAHSCLEVGDAITGTKYPFFVDKCLLSGETAGPISSEGFFFVFVP